MYPALQFEVRKIAKDYDIALEAPSLNLEFRQLEAKFKIDRPALLDQMRTWYDGYSWDGENRVYNPFGVLKFLNQKQFKNYWTLRRLPQMPTAY